MARFTRHAAWLVAGALMMAGAAGPAALWPAEARAQDALAALDGPTRALFQAVEAGDAAAVRRALDAGADVTARDASGRTVAQIARHLGRRDVVAALSGARPPESSGPPASSGPSASSGPPASSGPLASSVSGGPVAAPPAAVTGAPLTTTDPFAPGYVPPGALLGPLPPRAAARDLPPPPAPDLPATIAPKNTPPAPAPQAAAPPAPEAPISAPPVAVPEVAAPAAPAPEPPAEPSFFDNLAEALTPKPAPVGVGAAEPYNPDAAPQPETPPEAPPAEAAEAPKDGSFWDSVPGFLTPDAVKARRAEARAEQASAERAEAQTPAAGPSVTAEDAPAPAVQAAPPPTSQPTPQPTSQPTPQQLAAGPRVPEAPDAPPPTSREPLRGVVLYLSDFVRLGKAAPPVPEDRTQDFPCVIKRRGASIFCLEYVTWPSDIAPLVRVDGALLRGTRAIMRYDGGRATFVHALMPTESFDAVVGLFRQRYGEPTETFRRRIAPFAEPRRENPTVAWRSVDPLTGAVTSLEIRTFDDARGGFPDTHHGAILLYAEDAQGVFPHLSNLDLMMLNRAVKGR